MTATARALTLSLLLIAVALGGYAWWQHRAAEDARNQLGIDAGRVVSETFATARELRVARLTGEVGARSTEAGWVFNSEQRTRAPYSVNYFVDLKRIRRGDWTFDADRKVMTIEIPDVTVEKPSIDMSKAQVEVGGLWVSRKAGIALNRKGATFMAQTVNAKASSDKNLNLARAAATEAVRAYVTQPLEAAGIGDVEVVVRFPWQGRQSTEQWDRTSRPDEVLSRHR